jgi:crotonobetainyl-CoA:carnitine CoA-transferase CaiB-like acyl-CoA transferase
LISGKKPKRHGNAHPNIVPYQTFKARNDYFALGVGNDLQWKRLCTKLGQDGWAEDKRFTTNADRVENREPLVQLMGNLFEQEDAEYWISQIEEIGIPVTMIKTIDQVFEDPQVLAREMKVDTPHPTAGTVPLVGSPLKIPTSPVEYRLPPPLLGEHTGIILKELLDFDDDGIDELRELRVI